MTVNITIIALFVRVMETHAKGGTIGIAQLKAESAQKVPLRFRAELVGQGNIHCPAHAGIPTLLGLLAAGGQFARSHFRSDDLPFDHVLFMLGPVVLFATTTVRQAAARIVGDLPDSAVSFGPADWSDGEMKDRHITSDVAQPVGK